MKRRWHEPTLLRDKLYVNLEELRRTAAFMRATGFSIYRTAKKKKKDGALIFPTVVFDIFGSSTS